MQVPGLAPIRNPDIISDQDALEGLERPFPASLGGGNQYNTTVMTILLRAFNITIETLQGGKDAILATTGTRCEFCVLRITHKVTAQTSGEFRF